jgi:hypothetical protein
VTSIFHIDNSRSKKQRYDSNRLTESLKELFILNSGQQVNPNLSCASSKLSAGIFRPVSLAFGNERQFAQDFRKSVRAAR